MLSTVARIVRAVAWGIAGVVVVGVILYVTEANTGNWLVGSVMDVARFFAEPFRFIFQLDENKAQVVFNWGIAAIAYAAAGQLIAMGLDHLAARSARRSNATTRTNTA